MGGVPIGYETMILRLGIDAESPFIAERGICNWACLLVWSREAARFLCIVRCCLGEAFLTYEKQRGCGPDSGTKSLSVAEMYEMGRGCLRRL